MFVFGPYDSHDFLSSIQSNVTYASAPVSILYFTKVTLTERALTQRQWGARGPAPLNKI